MTELSREIFENYQVRKTKKQKQAFISLLQKHIPQMQVQETGFPKSRNLIIGDPESAKVLLSAHYDTCTRLPFPNFIMPKLPAVSIAYSFLIVIPVLVLLLLSNRLVGQWIQDPLLLYFLNLTVYLLFLILLLGGPANKHTANDNTSGVITLLEIYQQMSETEKAKTCFIFFDNEEQGLFGSAQFRKKHKKIIKDKLLINFDCVSDGDTFLLGISKTANQKYHMAIANAFTSENGKTVMLENLKKIYYPSDQAGFPVAIAVAALKYKKPFGYYMNRIHTKHDTVFEEENVRFLTRQTIRFIQSA